MSELKMFPSEASGDGKNKQKEQQAVKPFIKKIEAPHDFICNYTDGDVDCGKKIQKGETAWLVLTDLDINKHREAYPNEKPAPSMLCEDCMDKKTVKDREQIQGVA